MPKAKMSVVMSDRYSLTLGRSFDRGLSRRRRLQLMHRKLDQERHHDEVDQHPAEKEKHRRRDKVGQEGCPLLLIQAGRHEHVELASR